MWGKTKKVESIARYIAPPRLSLISCPLLVKLIFPLNVSVMSEFAEMAPPCMAELLIKLLVPVKDDDALVTAKIAPPLFAELLIKLLVPLKVRTQFSPVRTAPPL